MLCATAIHLWLCRHDQIPDSDNFKRRVLSGYTGVAPGDWQFARNEQGKPAIAGTTHALDFNLSHSGDWLACAVTAGTAVGVDIESIGRGRDVMRLARRFFRPEEVAALQDCRGARRRDRFYDFWTLKEAAVKARGETLVSGLESRGFALTIHPRRQLKTGCITLTTPEVAATAQYYLLDPLPGYRLAICWMPATPVPPRLRLFELRDGATFIPRNLTLRAGTRFD